MADWSQLPKDLLHLISQKLNSQFYQLRFRSVCSSWRSSTPQNHHHHLNLPPKFPIPSNNDDSTFPLSKRTLFLISPPPNPHTLHPWLIKIGPDSRDLTRLWHPLSRDIQFSIHSPDSIDFNHLPVIDLGCEFVIGDFPSQSSSPPLNNHNNTSLYMEKVVVFEADADTWQVGKGRCSILLTIHISGKLAVFRCVDEMTDERCGEKWMIIPDMLTPYDDVCVYKGRPFAVDSTGRAVVVGPDLSVEMVAGPVFGGDKKFLVESEGELLLVDKYLSCLMHCLRDDDDDGDGDGDGDGGGYYLDGEFYEIGRERAVRFDVFRLDEERKKWVEVKSLEDRVLFLGEDCAFSVSALDLRIGYGNCVIFRDDVYSDSQSSELGVGVFHFGQFRIAPLSCFPCYSMFFWPPPEWAGLR